MATTSRLRAGGAWSLRRHRLTGETYLRRWTLVRDSGELSLRGRASTSSLESRFKVRFLRARALGSLVHREGWPQQTMREELLLATQLGLRRKAEPPLEIRGLRLRSPSIPDVVGVRRLYRSQLRPLPDDRVQLRTTPSPLAARQGYPLVAQLRYGDLRIGEVLELRGLGGRFQGVYNVPAQSHRFRRASYPARFTRMLQADTDGRSTFLRRFELAQEPTPRAEATLEGVRPLLLRASTRGRHAYAITRGLDGVRQLRVLDVGRTRENLPPVVILGGRMEALATSSEGVELRLRGRALDSNGDLLGLRWTAPGVRFSDPNFGVTRAPFPIGETQVRLRAREVEGLVPFEGWDTRTVVVRGAVAVDSPPGLRTELRAIFPNPANPRVRIAYTVGRAGTVRITLHDVAGRRVRILMDGHQGRGAYDLVWDGRDDAGHHVASGVYHLRLDAEGTIDTGRVVLVR